MKNYFLFLAVLALSANALAWGKTGHRIVGEIAQRHLNPQAASTVKNLLNGHTLGEVANWADDIRSDKNYVEVAAYHYASIPRQFKTYEESPKNPKGDIVVAINAIADFLKSGDPSAFKNAQGLAKMDRTQALKLLAHFVGDIHQPLHGGYADDMGGNAVHVHFKDQKYETNLHAVWDQDIIDDTKLSYTEYATLVDHVSPEQTQLWKSLNPADWINEDIAVRSGLYVYPDKQPGVANGQVAMPFISYDYIYKNRDLLEQRLLQGGVRLANLLNSIF